jgi:hypothetical protein
MQRLALASLVLATLGTDALAEPDDLTAGDTAGAPPPGQESGRVEGGDPPVSISRAVGRGVLLVPRLLVTAAFAPVRGLVWVYDRYQISERYKRIFFNTSETIGIVPTAHVDASYGVTAGARFVHRDLFGAGEHFSARAQTGGRFNQRYLAALRSGHRFGDHVEVEASSEFEKRPRDAFYGIGNDAPGIQGRHRQRLMRARSAIDLRVVSDFHVRAAGALSDIEYGPSDRDNSIEMVYDPATLPGFTTGVRDVYGELELRWDGRRAGHLWDPPAMISNGTLAAAFLGRDHQYGMAGDYWRYGADLQHFIRLGTGPRVLITRVRGEAVDGEDVSFTELPQLGGAMFLRGYRTDRFRDRVAAVGSLEYQWDLGRHMAASVFVDAGRVYPSLEDLTLEGLRVGYGVGAQFHTGSSFIARANLATSKDGGLFFNLAFDPVFEIHPREGRR